MKTVIGLFDSAEQAESAAQELENNQIRREDISMVTSNAGGQYDRYKEQVNPTASEDVQADSATDTALQGAGTGAAIGAISGGGLGLLAGLGMLAIPGFGPIAATGWMLSMLSGAGLGAATGAVAGGLIGALVGAGVPHEQAALYQEGVRRGGTLLAVRAAEADVNLISNVLSNHGAVDIDERSASWSQSNMANTVSVSAPTNASAPAMWPQTATADANQGTMPTESEHISRIRDEDAYESDFRKHFQSTYAGHGWNYEAYDPAYRYGYELASDTRYRGRDWNAIEPEVRTDWDNRSPGSWEMFKHSIRYAWDKATGAERGGIKTGGYAQDGTPDTRGISEKVADAVTGDRIDDKTGLRI